MEIVILQSQIVHRLMWLGLAPMIKKKEEESPLPRWIKQAQGIVLEIGPGSGNQLSRYDQSKIQKLYGIEPNVALHHQLQETADQVGLHEKFTIVPYGVEDFDKLRKSGIEEGSVDTIMSVSVLCSVPRPQEMTKAMYKLLKPGGQLIVHEHIVSEDPLSNLVQGGCKLLFGSMLNR